MAQACLQAILASVDRADIESIELKGSSIKAWDSPIDYVPELSDVDVHLLFADDDAAHRWLDPVARGLRIQTLMNARYQELIPTPLHVPRVQLVILNELRRQPEYVPSPPATVRLLFGQSQSVPDIDPEMGRALARRQILNTSDFVATLGRHVADMPGKHLWQLVRSMTWRVAPTGPRVLELLGLPHAEAWSLSRTSIHERLLRCGEHDLARNYALFYQSAWDGFLSGFGNTDSARGAVQSGALVLQRGISLAQDK